MEIALVTANILLVIATGALVWVTWCYAGHTKHMADVMYKDYELRTTPLADIKVFVGVVSKPRMKFSLIVTNKGYCRIRIIAVQWNLWSKIQQKPEPIRQTFPLPYTWLAEGQQQRFDLPEINIPERWWVPEFNPQEHIAVDGWVMLTSPTDVVKQCEIKL